MIERVTPVVCLDASHAQRARETSPSHKIETRSFMKKLINMIKRRHPLFAVSKITRKVPHKRSPGGSKSFNVEDKTDHDRTVTPVDCRDTSHAQCHERSMLNEVDIDFRILGLPHAVVNVREVETS